jgi:phytoene desaturase
VNGPDVVVVGSGIGGLVSALLLAERKLSVVVLESASEPGGKAGTAHFEGCEFDTGPSILTLPQVFEEVFREVGERLDEHVTLLRPEPAFRYYFADHGHFDVHHLLDDTVDSVRSSFGADAAREFAEYLEEARAIWEAAAPNFVLSEAPRFSKWVFGSLLRLPTLSRIDALRSMNQAIEARVRTPELRMILQRYATYNGSDVRRAPATLGCIAHVELGLGGFGVRGGIYELVRALVASCRARGVEFVFDACVDSIELARSGVSGVVCADGRRWTTRQVVVNADVAQVFDRLLPGKAARFGPPRQPASMSAYNAVYRAARRERAAHAVLFPSDYLAEFRDIFEEGRVPREPTVYLCAQEVAQGRSGWTDDEPVFAMVNAPALSMAKGPEADPFETQTPRLIERGLLSAGDRVVWRRTPEELAERFRGSDGALYGAASNDKWSAFRRAANEVVKIPGLFVASGSAHPGGGLPLVAQSGRQAARALLRRRGLSP